MSRTNYRRGVRTNAEVEASKVRSMNRMAEVKAAAASAKPVDTENENKFIKALAATASNRAGGADGDDGGDAGRSSTSRGIESIGAGVSDIIKTYKSNKASS